MQPLSKAIIKLFGIQYLLCFLVLLLEMSFGQFLFAGTVPELDLGLTAEGASRVTTADALRAKMAEELDLGVGPELIAKHPRSGGGGGSRGGGSRGGGWSDGGHAAAQAAAQRHREAERAHWENAKRETDEAEAEIDCEVLGDCVKSRGSRSTSARSTPDVRNQTRNVVPSLDDPAEDRTVAERRRQWSESGLQELSRQRAVQRETSTGGTSGVGQTGTTTGGTPRGTAETIRNVGSVNTWIVDQVVIADRIRQVSQARKRKEAEERRENYERARGWILTQIKAHESKLQRLTRLHDGLMQKELVRRVMDKTWDIVEGPALEQEDLNESGERRAEERLRRDTWEEINKEKGHIDALQARLQALERAFSQGMQ